MQCEVLKIDEARRNIVVSRRSLIEKQREEDREQLLANLEVGQLRKGVVKNIADFGAFVDLGGIDGLLHITDMSWERIGHPSEMVSIDQEIEVMILHIDREKQKIALGLKQKQANPWDDVEEKYPVGTKVKGTVVNVMSYGAFVKLEPGIEGLVHISEMSWTKRINHPSELVQISDEIEVMILAVDRDGQQLSLGMKQTHENPWDSVAERYPIDSVVTGQGSKSDQLRCLHRTRGGDRRTAARVGHVVDAQDQPSQRDARKGPGGAVQGPVGRSGSSPHRPGPETARQDPWAHDIPNKYQPGQVVKGDVTKITNFGVFVGLEDGLEGLLHISELADHKVENPEEIVKRERRDRSEDSPCGHRRPQNRPVPQACRVGRRRDWNTDCQARSAGRG